MDGRPTSEHAPFTGLPAVLVEEILEKTGAVAGELQQSLEEIADTREEHRERLVGKGLVTEVSSLPPGEPPTTCAADGSYAIERLMATDLVAAAAVVVEGLSPPSEKRHWEQPRHRPFVAAEPHVADTSTVLRAVMMGEELRLLADAPHGLAMFDGTLSLPVIYFNQALNKAPQARELKCAKEFLAHCVAYLEAYLDVLRSEESGQQRAGLPKYSTRRELGEMMGWPESIEDRGMLTFLLHEGEMTKPVSMEREKWHLGAGELPEGDREEIGKLEAAIQAALWDVRVFYLKPQRWLPALRVEVPGVVADDKDRLASVVRGLTHQMAAPAMLEPYPVFLADRIVKALAKALPAVRQVVTQEVSERSGHDPGEVWLALHSYRSEGGQ